MITLATIIELHKSKPCKKIKDYYLHILQLELRTVSQA